jgi:hypothetical protein
MYYLNNVHLFHTKINNTTNANQIDDFISNKMIRKRGSRWKKCSEIGFVSGHIG